MEGAVEGAAPSVGAASPCAQAVGRSRVTVSSGEKEAEWKPFLLEQAKRQIDGRNLRRRQVEGLHKVRGALGVLSAMGRKPGKKAGDPVR